jgi:type II secretory pathway component PulK
MQLFSLGLPARAFAAGRSLGEGTRALSRRRPARSGVALIVVLFAVALVSIVVLAYFNLALMNRNISFSSAGEARANIIALSALDYVKGDLISEIQYGSSNEIDSASSVPIYYPLTNTTMVPYRMTTNLATPDYTLPPNLVKWTG